LVSTFDFFPISEDYIGNCSELNVFEKEDTYVVWVGVVYMVKRVRVSDEN